MHRRDEMCVSVSVKSGWSKRASNSGSLPLSLTCRPAVMETGIGCHCPLWSSAIQIKKKGEKTRED